MNIIASSIAFTTVFATAMTSCVYADPSVTVTDNSAHTSPYLRWDQFSTNLSATVTDPPQSNAETQIIGPTWAWSTSKYAFSGRTDTDHVTLVSPVQNHGQGALDAGGNSIIVTAQVTFGKKDLATGNVTFVTYSGSTAVKFFVRIPVSTEVVSTSQHPVNGQVFTISQGAQPPVTGTFWGHYDDYTLQIMDNQSPAQAYGNGLAREVFSGISPNGAMPNGPEGEAVFNLNIVDHQYDGTGSPVSSFTDTIMWLTDKQPTPINNDTVELTFNQTWHCMEATPPYASPQLYTTPGTKNFLSGIFDTTLNTYHVVNHFGYSDRS